jgi:hypothetical protein
VNASPNNFGEAFAFYLESTGLEGADALFDDELVDADVHGLA